MAGKSYFKGNLSEEELKKKLAQASNDFRKNMVGIAAGDKEIAMLKDSIPKAEIDAKFIAERTGAAVSEEELEMLKKLMPR